MALYAQAGIGASLDLEHFPKLTFGGFKTRHTRKQEPWSCKYKWKQNEGTDFPCLIPSKSSTRRSSIDSLSGTGLLLSSRSSLANAKMSFSDGESTSSIDRIRAHSFSERTLNSLRNKVDQNAAELGTNELQNQVSAKPSIQIVNCHSSIKCGTNSKSWFIKVALVNVQPDYWVCIKTVSKAIQIKIKFGPEASSIEKIFGAKQYSVRKNLKFSGFVDLSSVSARLDRNGHLLVQLIEHMDY